MTRTLALDLARLAIHTSSYDKQQHNLPLLHLEPAARFTITVHQAVCNEAYRSRLAVQACAIKQSTAIITLVSRNLTPPFLISRAWYIG